MQINPGYLEVTLLEVSRLNVGPNMLNAEDISQIEVHCTMSIDSTPWVQLTQYNGVPYMILDLIISKTSSQQLGVVFKQELVPEIGQVCVLVETIVATSPAAIAEMKKGDILIAVDGKRVANMNQVAKLVKSAVQRRFIIRVERKYVKADSDKQSSIKSDGEIKLGMEKASERKGNKSDWTAGMKGDHVTESTDSSKIKLESPMKFLEPKDTDGESADKSEFSSRLFRRRRSSSTHIQEETAQMPETPSRRISAASSLSTTSGNVQFCSIDDTSVTNLSDLYYTTKEKGYASSITFEETRNFQIDSEQHYLNVGVWGRVRSNEYTPRLLGYINAPIKLIVAQCAKSSTGRYLKCHALLPPESGTYTKYPKVHYLSTPLLRIYRDLE